MIELIFNGNQEDSPKSEHQSQFEDIDRVETYTVFSVSRSAEYRKSLKIGDDEVVEVEYENGIVDFLTEEDLESKAQDQRIRGVEMQVNRDTGRKQVYLDNLVVFDDNSRGPGKVVIKFLKLFVKKKGIQIAIGTAAKKLDKKLVPNEGLFVCQQDSFELDKEVSINSDLKNGTFLLMIHGFASNIETSFGAFAEPGNSGWSDIQKIYRGNVLAFNHYTLTKSVLQNALDLVEALPKNMIVDVLAFSRGGLVAEIIVKAAEANQGEKGEDGFWKEASELFHDTPQEMERLYELLNLVKTKNLLVNNMVRYACPAGGTTLASKRLVTYLKIVLNAIGLIPALRALPPYEILKELIISIVKQKDNTDVLPGVEVLNPASKFIKSINVLGAKYPITKTPTHVVSGDVAFGNFWRTVSVIFTDIFYRSDHDFVVDTRSMYQGFRRNFKIEGDSDFTAGLYYSFHKNAEVSHFNYLRNSASLKAVMAALSQKNRDVHFSWYDYGEKDKKYLRRSAKFNESSPTVIILPGIMGTNLKAGDRRVWVNFARLIFGGMNSLTLDKNNVSTDGIIGLYYNKLFNYLSDSHNVVEFGFDWRNDILESAEALNTLLISELNRTNKPVRLLAHSMGGLTVHALYSKYPDTWDKLKERNGFRSVFLGTPFRGSHAIINLYLKRHSVFNLIHKIDILNSSDDVLSIINDYIGMLQLLPAQKKYFESQFWEGLKKASGDGDKFIIPSSDKLKKASKLVEEFTKRPIQGAELVYIAGLDRDCTPHRVEVNNLLGAIKVFGTPQGDGAVTWESGILDQFEDRVWYTQVTHQALCTKRKLFTGIQDILETGMTNSTEFSKFPFRSRTELVEYEIPPIDPEILSVNNSHDLLEIEDDEIEFFAKETHVRVQVVHGDLSFSKYPVMVGHFEGDEILNAESAIDQHLNYELSRQKAIGSYPGKIGETLVILNGQGYFKGSVVVGLGFNERLTEVALETSLTRGFIELALQGNRCGCQNDSTSKEYGVSTILVGSEYAGLEINSALRALLRSVNRANKQIEKAGYDKIKPYTEIEIIELYSDKAININRALLKIEKESEFKHFIRVESQVSPKEGGLSRIPGSHEFFWWHRLQITKEKEQVLVRIEESNAATPELRNLNFLKFVSLSKTARAEVIRHDLDEGIVNVLLAQSNSKTENNRSLSKALYELLIPNEFKGFASDARNILLVLDEKTAEYPWELLNNSFETSDTPIAVRTGFIRQLHDAQYRPNVLYTRKNNAFIVGDPIYPSSFNPLPYAKKEAESIGKLLKEKFDFSIESSINEKSANVIQKLMEQPYRIIHLAGHGDFDPNDVKRSGMILSDDVFLNPSVINSLPEVPELVFINCCYLGATQGKDEQLQKRNWNKMAANLGTQFIRNGVKAVVAAGWAVDDNAAFDFAETFYQAMFNGDDFGSAVKRARMYCFQKYPFSNTWGAYQCYGNPQYRIRDNGIGDFGPETPFVHRDEILIALKNLSIKFSSIEHRMPENGHLRIEEVLRRGKSFTEDGYVYEAAAKCYFEINQKELALDLYQKSISKVAHNINIESRLHYMNLLVSKAISLARDRSDESEITDLLNKAEEQAEIILSKDSNGHCFSEIGGHYKRRAQISESDDERITFIKKSASFYYKSFKKVETIYALTNFLQMTAILYLCSGTKSTNKYGYAQESRADLLQRGKQLLVKTKLDYSDAWSTIVETDFLLAQLMVETAITKPKAEELTKEAFALLKTAWKRGGSWRIKDSVSNHYAIILNLVKSSRAANQSRTRQQRYIIESLEMFIRETHELD